MKNNEVWVTSMQERQLAACEGLMRIEPLIPIRIVLQEDVEMPLEKSRLYGPFSIEVVAWVNKVGSLAKMGWDADGREYVEY